MKNERKIETLENAILLQIANKLGLHKHYGTAANDMADFCYSLISNYDEITFTAQEIKACIDKAFLDIKENS
jgi:hypothetical protein